MTYEEAIKILHPKTTADALKGISHIDAVDMVETASVMACEALEKQIPKKPLHLHKNYYCPVCKEDGWMLWDDAEPNDFDNFCCKCGQAIDWSDLK